MKNGIFHQLLSYLRQNKAVWIAPLAAMGVLVLVVAVLLFQGPGRAPFVYSLF